MWIPKHARFHFDSHSFLISFFRFCLLVYLRFNSYSHHPTTSQEYSSYGLLKFYAFHFTRRRCGCYDSLPRWRMPFSRSTFVGSFESSCDGCEPMALFQAAAPHRCCLNFIHETGVFFFGAVCLSVFVCNASNQENPGFFRNVRRLIYASQSFMAYGIYDGRGFLGCPSERSSWRGGRTKEWSIVK